MTPVCGMWCLVVSTLPLGTPAVCAQPIADEDSLDGLLTPVTRQWQAEAIERLQAFRPEAAAPVLWTEECDDGLLLVHGWPRGILWLGREDWVYLESFWSHDGDPQVVLGIDRRGRIYRNFEHVCPHLPLTRPPGRTLDSLDAFLQTETGADEGPPDWQLIDDSAATAGRLDLPTAWEHAAEVAQAEQASPAARRTALLALIREGSEGSWAVVEPRLHGSTDWRLLEEALTAAEAADDLRRAAARDVVEASLGADPAERARRLAEAILATSTQEALARLLTFREGTDPALLWAALETVVSAPGQDSRTKWRAFPPLRNAVAALVALDREAAASLFRSLLDSPDVGRRHAGVYGVGELRLDDAVDALATMLDGQPEPQFRPLSACVALGKIGTPQAYEALAARLLQAPGDPTLAYSVLGVVAEALGGGDTGGGGTWANGWWATPPEDRPATARRLGAALEEVVIHTRNTTLSKKAREGAAALRESAP